MHSHLLILTSALGALVTIAGAVQPEWAQCKISLEPLLSHANLFLRRWSELVRRDYVRCRTELCSSKPLLLPMPEGSVHKRHNDHQQAVNHHIVQWCSTV